MDGEIIVGYVRGTCHTSKASFLLQLYLLNLIRVRSKAVINFRKCLDIVLAIRRRFSLPFRAALRCTITNFGSKVGKKITPERCNELKLRDPRIAVGGYIRFSRRCSNPRFKNPSVAGAGEFPPRRDIEFIAAEGLNSRRAAVSFRENR